MEFSPDGKWLAMGGWQGLHEFWRSDGSEPIRPSDYGPEQRIHKRFSLDGRYLIAWEQIPRVYNGATKEDIRVWKFPER